MDGNGMKYHRIVLRMVLFLLTLIIVSTSFVDAGRRRSSSVYRPHSRTYSYHPQKISPYKSPRPYTVRKSRSSDHFSSTRISSRHYSPSYSPSSGPHRSSYSSSAPRDSHGRIKRSQSARKAFMRQTGYPNGRPGYVIDHIVPLANGGADDPSNMQWQTKADAKAKDKWERKK